MEIESDCEIADHSTLAETENMDPLADILPADWDTMSRRWYICNLFSPAFSEETQLFCGRAKIDGEGRVIHDTGCNCEDSSISTHVECDCEWTDKRDPVNS